MRTILLTALLYRKVVLLLTFTLFFSLAMLAQPSNDNCNNAANRSSSTNCNTTQFNMANATASSGIPVGCAAGGTHYDVWFTFTATNATHTATFTNLQSGITNPEVQIFSGSCGSLTSLVCGTTTATATGLTIGNNYYVRFSNVGATVTSNGRFDMCITNPGTPPANDECSAAISRTSNTSCNNNGYDMRYATASAGIPGVPCVAGVHYDIWFSFTAAGATQTATISNRESDFTNPEVAIFSGGCGALTQLACGTTSATATGLAIGNTYYVRVSNVGAQITSNNGEFDICITHQPAAAANDNCSGATTLTPAANCNNITGNLRYATSAGPAGACGGATATTTYDVWYTFQATSTTHAVTVGNLGSRLTATSTYMEILSGAACGGFVSLGCQAVSVTNGRLTSTTLTVGNFYYVRVYVLTNPTASNTADWNFSICLQHPPANDVCTGAVILTPGATCTNTAGKLDLTVASVLPLSGCRLAGTYYDVWYRFTATALSHTVTVSSAGANFTAPRIIIYNSAGCPVGAPLACASALTLTTATAIGTIYYVQIANFGINPSGAGTVADFNICITAAAAPPANDLCTGAISITSGITCSNIAGTLINATASAPLVPGACGIATAPDVWYSFVAQTAYPEIRLSAIGLNMQTNGRMQLLTGACGALVAVGACHVFPAAATTTLLTRTNPGGAGLTVGQTYYIRITHNTLAAPVAAGTYTWNMCVVDYGPLALAAIDYGKSYVNLTDGTIGGPINPGDVLEIRATLVVNRSGAPLAVRAIDSVAFYDTLSPGVGFGYNPGTIALRTNEGKLYSPSNATYYTDAFDDVADDAGWYSTAGAGSDTMIRINMGANANYVRRGRLRSNSRPSNFGNTCIIMATYRVTVNAAYGTKIDFGGGAFRYRDSASGAYYTVSFPPDSLMVYQTPDACLDAISATNILGDEVNGSFGASAGPNGAPQNRGVSTNTDYLYGPFNPAGPNDYYYAVANNTSATGSIVQTAVKAVPSATRVFNLWDITGDHTGAADPARGNPPCNLAAPISAANPCGYMMVINSAYKTDKAFSFNVNGACTETYYEISAWFKNICYKCGCDSAGRSSTTALYIPTAPGDSAGVRPNIAVEINGIDYYTTGDLLYQGLGGTQTGSDTLNTWVKRTFVYKTGLSETNFLLTLRNNAPGGGGNDWALDDISLKTCTPNIVVTPNGNVSICIGGTVSLGADIHSYYNSYTYSQWEVSTDGGTNWTLSGPVGGPGSPVWNGTEYVYHVDYPTFVATEADDNKQFRVIVGTTIGNTSSEECSFTDGAAIVLDVMDANDDLSCDVLANSLLVLKGKNVNNEAILDLSTLREDSKTRYEIQRSFDGMTYTSIATIYGNNNAALDKNFYTYTDPELLKAVTWYRFKMIDDFNKSKYSNVVRLIDTKTGISIQSLNNPFSSMLKFELVSGYDGEAKIELLNHAGQIIKSRSVAVRKGGTNVVMENTGNLTTGFYILRISFENTVLYRKLVKNNY